MKAVFVCCAFLLGCISIEAYFHRHMDYDTPDIMVMQHGGRSQSRFMYSDAPDYPDYYYGHHTPSYQRSHMFYDSYDSPYDSDMYIPHIYSANQRRQRTSTRNNRLSSTQHGHRRRHKRQAGPMPFGFGSNMPFNPLARMGRMGPFGNRFNRMQRNGQIGTNNRNNRVRGNRWGGVSNRELGSQLPIRQTAATNRGAIRMPTKKQQSVKQQSGTFDRPTQKLVTPSTKPTQIPPTATSRWNQAQPRLTQDQSFLSSIRLNQLPKQKAPMINDIATQGNELKSVLANEMSQKLGASVVGIEFSNSQASSSPPEIRFGEVPSRGIPSFQRLTPRTMPTQTPLQQPQSLQQQPNAMGSNVRNRLNRQFVSANSRSDIGPLQDPMNRQLNTGAPIQLQNYKPSSSSSGRLAGASNLKTNLETQLITAANNQEKPITSNSQENIRMLGNANNIYPDKNAKTGSVDSFVDTYIASNKERAAQTQQNEYLTANSGIIQDSFYQYPRMDALTRKQNTIKDQHQHQHQHQKQNQNQNRNPRTVPGSQNKQMSSRNGNVMPPSHKQGPQQEINHDVFSHVHQQPEIKRGTPRIQEQLRKSASSNSGQTNIASSNGAQTRNSFGSTHSSAMNTNDQFMQMTPRRQGEMRQTPNTRMDTQISTNKQTNQQVDNQGFQDHGQNKPMMNAGFVNSQYPTNSNDMMTSVTDNVQYSDIVTSNGQDPVDMNTPGQGSLSSNQQGSVINDATMGNLMDMGNKFSLGPTNKPFASNPTYNQYVSESTNKLVSPNSNNKETRNRTNNQFTPVSSNDRLTSEPTSIQSGISSSNQFALKSTNNPSASQPLTNSFGQGSTNDQFASDAITKQFPPLQTNNQFAQEPSNNQFASEFAINQFTGPTNDQFLSAPTNNHWAPEASNNQFPLSPTNNQFVPELTNNQFVPEPTNNQFAPETTNNQFAPETTNNQFAPDITNNQFAPETTNNQFAPETTNNQFAPEITNNQFAPDINNNQFAPEITNNQFAPEINNNQFASEATNNQFAPEPTNSMFAAKPANSMFAPETATKHLIPTANSFTPETPNNNFASGPPNNQLLHETNHNQFATGPSQNQLTPHSTNNQFTLKRTNDQYAHEQSNNNFGSLGFMDSQFGQPGPMDTQFGQPGPMDSQFGQPGQMDSQFGQPGPMDSQFGQPGPMDNQFGQPRPMENQFGQSGPMDNKFGQPGPMDTQFGQNGPMDNQFGQPGPMDNQFGQPGPMDNQFGQPGPMDNQFGQPGPMDNQFGQPGPMDNQFGQPGPMDNQFGLPSLMENHFGPEPSVSEFGFGPEGSQFGSMGNPFGPVM